MAQLGEYNMSGTRPANAALPHTAAHPSAPAPQTHPLRQQMLPTVLRHPQMAQGIQAQLTGSAP